MWFKYADFTIIIEEILLGKTLVKLKQVVNFKEKLVSLYTNKKVLILTT